MQARRWLEKLPTRRPATGSRQLWTGTRSPLIVLIVAFIEAQGASQPFARFLRLILWEGKRAMLQRFGIYEYSFSATAEFVVAVLLAITLVMSTLA